MAVLKTFELGGNKLSFANWISNLSPTETPFTSMISKEKIDQTQYSWQTDSLAPASAETFSEGSQASMQSRPTTKVLTNFTTIIRKATSVSDTNECTHAYGRRDELAYRMGKIGKEVLRDIEYANLSRHLGNPGTETAASRHAGFKNLCAPMFVPDPDTMAVTHQGIAIVDPRKPWFTKKDIFSVTTNLFLSGSKADKIMFHPKHMAVFSDLIGYNDEEPLIYRMFENLSEEYNMKVTKIKDPVGRVYSLIPNRFMPESQVYFFHESDWSQMVLREPTAKKLAKKGSSQQVMIEAEVGLKHKNEYASGVLHLVSIDYKTDLHADKTKMTAFIGDTTSLHFDAETLVGLPAANVDFSVVCSDEKVVELFTKEDQTDAAGQSTQNITAKLPGFVSIYAHRDAVDHRLLTNPVYITVSPPLIEWVPVGSSFPVTSRTKNYRVNLKKVDGTNLPNGTPVYLHCEEGIENLGVVNPTPTVNTGRVNVSILPKKAGKYNVRISFDDKGLWKSEPYFIEVQENDIKLTLGSDTKKHLTRNIDGTQSVTITVTDGADRMTNVPVTVTSSNEAVAKFTAGTYNTNNVGVATTQLTPVNIGQTTITATYLNKSVSYVLRIGDGDLKLSVDKPVMEYDDKSNITFTVQVVGADGKALNQKDLVIDWDNTGTPLEMASAQSMTDVNGITTITAKVLNQVGVAKMSVHWALNDVSADIDVNVIPTKYVTYFQPSTEIRMTMGIDVELAPNGAVRHSNPNVPTKDRELVMVSSNSAVVSVTPGKSMTDALGFGDFKISPVGPGTALLQLSGTDTDTEKFSRSTRKVTVEGLVANISCSDGGKILNGEGGTVTITLQKPGGSSIMYSGKADISASNGAVVFATSEVQFTNGIGNANFTTASAGVSTLTLTMPSGYKASIRGTPEITVEDPIIRLFSDNGPSDVTGKVGTLTKFFAQLYKPDGKTVWAKKDEVIAYHATPAGPGSNIDGRTIATDEQGLATLSATPTSAGNYEVRTTYKTSQSNIMAFLVEA